MAPKKINSDMFLGEHTPTDPSASGGVFDKKKDDTTPTQVVDKDVTPSEDDKKKKDSSSAGKKGTTSNAATSSNHTQLTEITELSPSREHRPVSILGKRAGQERRAGRAQERKGPNKKRLQARQTKFNKGLKDLRKKQAKKNKALKHPRSFAQNIMRILRSVNESQEQDSFAHKRVNQLSIMIFDSFANDLCDKLCATGVELMKNTGKRQLGSNEIKAAMKLVLPHDMSTCAEEAVQVSLTSYKDSTNKFQGKIAQAGGNKKLASGTKKD